MGGLIPLRLKATDTRRSSPSPPPSIPLPPIPPKSPHRPRPKPVTNLKIFPYTEGDWREVMEEVKTLYLKRQCKQCSARCIQTLESIKDPVRTSIPLSNHQADIETVPSPPPLPNLLLLLRGLLIGNNIPLTASQLIHQTPSPPTITHLLPKRRITHGIRFFFHRPNNRPGCAPISS